MRALDLFCGVGGVSAGLARVGFEVVGVDLIPQPGYPFEFVQADAMTFLAEVDLDEFDAVCASPPCPRYSSATSVAGDRENHPDLVEPVLAELERWGGAYAIENVPGSPVPNPLILCGSEFGLGAMCKDGVWRQLRRHRLFGSNVAMMRPGGCAHKGQPVGVYGKGGGQVTRGYMASKSEAAEALGITWAANHRQLRNAIPPVYGEWIGGYLADAATRRCA